MRSVSVRYTARLAIAERERQGAELAAVHARVRRSAGDGDGRTSEGEFDLVEQRRARRARRSPSTTSTSSARTTSSQRPRHAQLDLRLQRRRHPQHPRVRARLPGDAHDRARAELPLDERDPRGGQRRDRAQLGAEGETALVRARRRRSGAGDRGRGRAGRSPLRGGADRRARRGRLLRRARSRSSTG